MQEMKSCIFVDTGLYIFLCCQRDQLHNTFELAKRNTLHVSLTRASFRAQAFSEPSRPPLVSAQGLSTPASTVPLSRPTNGDYSGFSIASSYRSRTASDYSCASDCRPLLRSATSSR